MKPRKLLFIGLVVAAVGVAFVIVRSLPSNRTAAAAPAASGKKSGPGGGGAPLPVYTHRVEPQVLEETVTATGSVVADESVDLVSEFSGKVVEISFQESSRVKRGDVLLKLDDTELRAEIVRAESRLQLARAQAERQRVLVQGGGTTRESLEAAISEVRVLEAELALVQAQLAKTELRAPFDGVIGLRYVSVGAYLTPTTRIATLQKLDPVKIEFAIAERHLERLQADAEVVVAVAGMSEPLRGRVYAIEPRVDPTTRTLRLRARAPNPEGRALPGGFATIEMPLRRVPEALLVPASAVVSGLNEQQVFVVEDGRAQRRTVQTGLRLAREVQIVSGLEPGAVVITSGQMQLRPGVAVRPVERPDPSAAGAPEAKSEEEPRGQAVSSIVAP